MTDTGRVGTFSSSSIYKLIPYGKRDMTEEELEEHKRLNPKSKKKTIESGFSQLGETYIYEKQRELLLGKELKPDVDSRPTSWGNFVQHYVFSKDEMIDISNSSTMSKRYVNKNNPFHTGCPDYIAKDTAGEIKCYYLDNYTKTYDSIEKAKVKGLEVLKKECAQEYWQILSNSDLATVEYGELILFCPYKKEVKEIIELVNEIVDESELSKVAFISLGNIEILPYIPDDSKYYKNFNKYRFKVPQEDKDFLTMRINEATKILRGNE